MAKKLSDTATVILSTAADRDGHRVLPLINTLKAPRTVVQRVLKSLLADGLVEEVPASRDDEVWEQSEQRGRTTLAITTAGLVAIGIEDEIRPTKPAKGRTRAKKADKGTNTAKSSPLARTGGSKQDIVIALLRRGNGASIEQMMEATDWRAHSVRGFMSGALKKRLKLDVVSEKDAKTGDRRYYVAAIAFRK